MSFDADLLFCSDLPTQPDRTIGTILITGATGYIGGRLVPELLARGYRVRVLVRGPSPELKQRWPGVDVVVGDVLDFPTIDRALHGVDTAYYLIHSLMLGSRRFETVDQRAAHNFRIAAQNNKLNRIIYLGGLGDIKTGLSTHLRSRMKVAAELRKGTVPVTILRAAIIIGSGSASYEILNHLVRKLPFIFLPPWTRTRCQPIGIRDVIKYLVGVLEIKETSGRFFDIGGKDVLTYEKMLRILADLLGKKRFFIPIPFYMVKLYSYLVSLVTPVPVSITMCLMGGCTDEVVCLNRDIQTILPFKPLAYRETQLRAMTREDQDRIYTRWSDAYPPAHELALKLVELDPPPKYSSSYSLTTKKDPVKLFENICKIGGKTGWFNTNWLWRLRGMIDRVLLGVGTSRGRRSTTGLRINDVIDFWRVEDLKESQMLLLRAEMKLPGKAWLRFNIQPVGDKFILAVIALFQTDSFFGKVYWYIFLPFHRFIFYDIIHQINKRS